MIKTMATETDNQMNSYFAEEDIINKKSAKKVGRRRYYPSNKPQAYIRNAATGELYPYVVGSADQRRFYKMVDATGTCDPEGFVILTKDDLPNSNTNHLFYDSPEQCMSSLHVTIQPDAIAKWREQANVFNTGSG
jgi:hypothetical protein